MLQLAFLPSTKHPSSSSSSTQQGDTGSPEPFCLASKTVKELSHLPDLGEYLKKMCHDEPFIVRGYAADWPALRDSRRQWSDTRYLAEVAGPARVVPVEIGEQYTEPDWRQDVIPWQDFLHVSGWNLLDNVDSNKAETKYLAQHNVFRQFPALEADIVLPDIIYSCPPAPSFFPSYTAPMDEEGMETAIINAWVGPKGTTTPVHFDPYYNAYGECACRPANDRFSRISLL